MDAARLLKPQGGRRMFQVFNDLSGGVRIAFGSDEMVLSPKETVDLATTLLKSVGVDVKLDGSMFDQ